jgi:hypothetical protein
MSFIGSDGLENQVRQFKAQLAQKGEYPNARVCYAECGDLDTDVTRIRARVGP